MKKVLFSALTATALMVFSGCGTTAPSTPDFNKCMMDGTEAPTWVCRPNSVEGGLVALGVAQPNNANDYQFQLDEAVAAARDSLAKRIEVKVKNMFKQFKATTGTGKDATFDKATQSVSKQIASQTLRGSKVINSWQSPTTKALYVLVGIPAQDMQQVKENIKNQAKTSFKNDKALWQKFLAQKADQKLDEAIDKEFGGGAQQGQDQQ
jgi:hypothetical protein